MQGWGSPKAPLRNATLKSGPCYMPNNPLLINVPGGWPSSTDLSLRWCVWRSVMSGGVSPLCHPPVQATSHWLFSEITHFVIPMLTGQGRVEGGSEGSVSIFLEDELELKTHQGIFACPSQNTYVKLADLMNKQKNSAEFSITACFNLSWQFWNFD